MAQEPEQSGQQPWGPQPASLELTHLWLGRSEPRWDAPAEEQLAWQQLCLIAYLRATQTDPQRAERAIAWAAAARERAEVLSARIAVRSAMEHYLGPL